MSDRPDTDRGDALHGAIRETPIIQRVSQATIDIAERDGLSDLDIEAVTFWFIWTKTGHIPQFAHQSLADAEAEAMRLARKCPGKKFIVLEAVSKFSATPTVAEAVS